MFLISWATALLTLLVVLALYLIVTYRKPGKEPTCEYIQREKIQTLAFK
jgi:hypothetical protein